MIALAVLSLLAAGAIAIGMLSLIRAPRIRCDLTPLFVELTRTSGVPDLRQQKGRLPR